MKLTLVGSLGRCEERADNRKRKLVDERLRALLVEDHPRRNPMLQSRMNDVSGTLASARRARRYSWKKCALFSEERMRRVSQNALTQPRLEEEDLDREVGMKRDPSSRGRSKSVEVRRLNSAK